MTHVGTVIEKFQLGEHMKMLTRLIKLRGTKVVVESSSKGWVLTYEDKTQ